MKHFRKRELGYRLRKIEFVKWKLERTRNIKISGRKKATLESKGKNGRKTRERRQKVRR